MVGEADGETLVPPTLQALLATRPTSSRPPSEPCSNAPQWRPHLAGTLVRALTPDVEVAAVPGLARPQGTDAGRNQPAYAEEDGYHSRRLLVQRHYLRRAAGATSRPSSTPASWLERHGAEVVELDELLGCPPEQVYKLRAEAWRYPATKELAATAKAAPRGQSRRRPLAGTTGSRENLFEHAQPRCCRQPEIDLALGSSSRRSPVLGRQADRRLLAAQMPSWSRPSKPGDRVGASYAKIGGRSPTRPRAGEAGRAPSRGLPRLHAAHDGPPLLHRVLHTL